MDEFFCERTRFLKLTINDRIGDVTEDYNLFLGDSYFEFWHYGQFADKNVFYHVFKRENNLCLGIGGTTYENWCGYLNELSVLPSPKKIIVNLGFNDLHQNQTIGYVLNHCENFILGVKKLFGKSEIFLLNVTQSPAFLNYGRQETVFNEALRRLSSRLGVTVWDVRSVISEAQQLSNCFCNDGVHFNGAGYAVFSRFLIKNLS